MHVHSDISALYLKAKAGHNGSTCHEDHAHCSNGILVADHLQNKVEYRLLKKELSAFY